jgi:MHS family alpha-ketoglutarate permease-like MFS transporter
VSIPQDSLPVPGAEAPPSGSSAVAVAADPTMRRRIKSVIGGSIGNLVEWYDWYVYSAAALYFAPIFFPQGDRTAQLLNAAAVFSVGFLVRPIGSWIMGLYADRKGRLSAMVVSMGAMGVASFVIALTPGYETIGVFAPILLVLARIAQGLCIGGEYAAVATYLSEVAGKKRRGFFCSFQYVTLIGGQLLALLVLVSLQMMLSAEDVAAWGWRILFVIGGISAFVALMIRRSLEETESFENMKKRSMPTGNTWRLLRDHPKELLYVLGLTVGGTLGFYVFSNYMQKFLVNTSGFPIDTASRIMVLAMILFAAMQPVMGWLSDRVGRKPLLVAFGIGGTLCTVPILTLLAGTDSAVVAFLAIAGALTIQSLYTAISGLYKAELFPTEVRALGVGLPYAIAVSALGGTAEMVALWLKQLGHETWFFWYVTFFMAVVLITSLVMRDTQRHSRILED